MTGGGGHPESDVWHINHSSETTPERLLPYGDNADRCLPVCALDSLSDTIRSTQIQHAMMIIVLSNKLKTGSGLHFEKANWFQSALNEHKEDRQENKLVKKQAIYVSQFREWPMVNCNPCRDMSDAYSDTDEHLPHTETRTERIALTEEKKSLKSQWPTNAPCQREKHYPE